MPESAVGVVSSAPVTTVVDVSAAANMAGSQFNDWKRLHLSRAKLKASSRTSALLSGFAMIAMVEINLNESMPSYLLIMFAISTTILVSIHLLALLISTCILPHLEAVSSMHTPSAVQQSPHIRMHFFIELAWMFSTVFGLVLFMVEIALVCWLQFYKKSDPAAWAATALLVPIVCLFLLFALHFYRILVSHKSQLTDLVLDDLNQMYDQLNSAPVDVEPREPSSEHPLISSEPKYSQQARVSPC